MRPRHRVSIRYQPVIIGLTEKIATQQLKSVSSPFDFLLQDRLISFKRTTSIFEMRFVAVIRKNRQGENERCAKYNQCDSSWFPQRPVLFFAGEESESGVTCGGQDQTRLESEPGQQDKTPEYWANGGANRIKQDRETCAIHSGF